MTTHKLWLSIFDYANNTNLSISTIRRRIKNKKVIFKKEGGKFYILATGNEIGPLQKKKQKLHFLEEENQQLKELVLEQEMLINLYEEKLHKNESYYYVRGSTRSLRMDQ